MLKLPQSRPQRETCFFPWSCGICGTEAARKEIEEDNTLHTYPRPAVSCAAMAIKYNAKKEEAYGMQKVQNTFMPVMGASGELTEEGGVGEAYVASFLPILSLTCAPSAAIKYFKDRHQHAQDELADSDGETQADDSVAARLGRRLQTATPTGWSFAGTADSMQDWAPKNCYAHVCAACYADGLDPLPKGQASILDAWARGKPVPIFFGARPATPLQSLRIPSLPNLQPAPAAVGAEVVPPVVEAPAYPGLQKEVRCAAIICIDTHVFPKLPSRAGGRLAGLRSLFQRRNRCRRQRRRLPRRHRRESHGRQGGGSSRQQEGDQAPEHGQAEEAARRGGGGGGLLGGRVRGGGGGRGR